METWHNLADVPQFLGDAGASRDAFVVVSIAVGDTCCLARF